MDSNHTKGCGDAFGDAQNKGGCVLIADDDQLNLRYLNRMLLDAGIPENKILMADNGDTALNIFEMNSDKIRAVVTDCDMPGLSGIDLIEKIHDMKGTEQPFMILHSSRLTLDALKENHDILERIDNAKAVGIAKGDMCPATFRVIAQNCNDPVPVKRAAENEQQISAEFIVPSGV